MTQKLILGVAAAALLGSGSVVLAQTPPTPNQPAQQQGGVVGTQKDAQAQSDWRSSKIVGVTVYNTAGENIGEVDDLIVGSDGRIENIVLGVGGFLGLGEKLVAVSFSDLKMSRDDRGHVHLVLNSSREALRSAPEFRYRGETRR